ncbi:MAG: type II secretion system protein GspN, partial [Nitrospirota bacterium]
MKIVFALLFVLALAVFGVWFVFTDTTIRTVIEDSFTDNNVSTELKGVRKGLFYSVFIDSMALKQDGAEIASLENVSIRVHPFSLLRANLSGSVEGTMYGGNVSGRIKFARNSRDLNLDMEKIRIEQVEFLKRIGIKGTGTISGRFVADEAGAHIEFSTHDAAFEPATYSGRKVPLDMFHTIRGAMDIRGDTVNLAAVSLEGREARARLKGAIKNKIMDLKMEIMPGRTFSENPFFLSDLGQYNVYPGY